MEVDPSISEQFIADCVRETERRNSKGAEQPTSNREMRRSEQVIHEAEASKARLFVTPGNDQFLHSYDKNNQARDWQTNEAWRATAVDENYLVIGTHVDQSIQQNIINSKYVDFAQLIPKNRISREEDNQLEIISRGGSTFFVPVSEREMSVISSFSKWEQAFRVFSNIYTCAYPSKAAELIQYNHIIYMASCTFIWDNVYT